MQIAIEVQEAEKIEKIENLLQNLNVKYSKNEHLTSHDFAIKIVMNEQKILNHSTYTLENIYDRIDDIAKKSNMIKIDKYTYVSKNLNPSDLGIFVWNHLEESSWFMDNVTEWIWIDKEDGVQDILQYIRQRDNEKVS